MRYILKGKAQKQKYYKYYRFTPESLFYLVLELTLDYNLAEEIQGWAELAAPGEVYDSEYFTVTAK